MKHKYLVIGAIVLFSALASRSFVLAADPPKLPSHYAEAVLRVEGMI